LYAGCRRIVSDRVTLENEDGLSVKHRRKAVPHWAAGGETALEKGRLLVKLVQRFGYGLDELACHIRRQLELGIGAGSH
jgi:hypothetical protein